MKLGQNFVKSFVRFLSNGVSRKIASDIFGPLLNLDLQICKIETALEHTIIDLKPANIHAMRKYAILK